MKIAIIGDVRRKGKDSPIIREAEKLFDKCLYVDIRKIRVDIEKNFTVRYNGTDLSDFDCILPIPTLPQRELFFIVLKTLSGLTYLPFDAERYLLISEDALLFKYLNQKGVPTRKFLLISSKNPLKEVLKEIKFPLIVKPPLKRVVVTNPQTLQDVVSLSKIGTPIRLETPVKAEKVLWAFMVKDEVVACYERSKKKVEKTDPSEILPISRQIMELVKCDFCALNFLKYNGQWTLNKLTLSPNFSRFEDITKKNIGESLLTYLYEKSKQEKRWWHKIFDDIFGR